MLVALDESPDAEAVLPPALGLTRLMDAAVTLAAVHDPREDRVATLLPTAWLDPDGAEARRGANAGAGAPQDAGEYLAALARWLVAEGRRVEARVTRGHDIAATIVQCATEVGADLAAMSRHGRGAWGRLAHGSVAGLVGALAAAPFGVVDWTRVPVGTRARRVEALHGAGNVVVLLFATSLLLRLGDPRTPPLFALTLSFAGGALSAVTGWLGDELVDCLEVGVDDGAHLDVPSSLSGRSAHKWMRAATHP